MIVLCDGQQLSMEVRSASQCAGCVSALRSAALASPVELAHDLGRFGHLLSEMRTMVCGMLRGSAVVWGAGLVTVRLQFIRWLVNVSHGCGPVLRTSVASRHDLRRFGYPKHTF